MNSKQYNPAAVLQFRMLLFCRVTTIFLLFISTIVSHAVSFSYDSLNRLTNVNYGNGSVINYTYDAAGNRLTYSGVVVNDTTVPSISIINPTSASNFTNTSATINLSGTASDDTGVTLVTWENYSGGFGDAIGTNSWSINNIPLQAGDNLIDVTAYDKAGNTADAFLDVTYAPPVGPAIQTSLSSGNLNLSWPAASASGFVLQYANSLTPPVQWSNIVANVTTNAGILNVSLPATNSQRFFRLVQ